MVERLERELSREAAEALGLDAVEDDEDEHRDGHGEGHVHVGGRDDPQVLDAAELRRQRQEVHRDQVHEVHEEHPHKECEAERRDDVAFAVEGVLDALIYEFDDELDRGLGLARHAAARLAGDTAEEECEGKTEHEGKEHRVDVDRPEVAVALVPDPVAIRLAERQVLQVMGDIGAGVGGRGFPATCSSARGFLALIE
jgi:hypothetical protein